MVYEEVKQKQVEARAPKGAPREKGIITDTAKRFQPGLPWLNRNNLNYYIRKIRDTPTLAVARATTKDKESNKNNISELTNSTGSNTFQIPKHTLDFDKHMASAVISEIVERSNDWGGC
jgi:hypothetical protein